MKKKNTVPTNSLLHLMNEIDDHYIDEALKQAPAKSRRHPAALMATAALAAAAIILILLASTLIWRVEEHVVKDPPSVLKELFAIPIREDQSLIVVGRRAVPGNNNTISSTLYIYGPDAALKASLPGAEVASQIGTAAYSLAQDAFVWNNSDPLPVYMEISPEPAGATTDTDANTADNSTRACGLYSLEQGTWLIEPDQYHNITVLTDSLVSAYSRTEEGFSFTLAKTDGTVLQPPSAGRQTFFSPYLRRGDYICRNNRVYDSEGNLLTSCNGSIQSLWDDRLLLLNGNTAVIQDVQGNILHTADHVSRVTRCGEYLSWLFSDNDTDCMITDLEMNPVLTMEQFFQELNQVSEEDRSAVNNIRIVNYDSDLYLIYADMHTVTTEPVFYLYLCDSQFRILDRLLPDESSTAILAESEYTLSNPVVTDSNCGIWLISALSSKLEQHPEYRSLYNDLSDSGERLWLTENALTGESFVFSAQNPDFQGATISRIGDVISLTYADSTNGNVIGQLYRLSSELPEYCTQYGSGYLRLGCTTDSDDENPVIASHSYNYVSGEHIFRFYTDGGNTPIVSDYGYPLIYAGADFICTCHDNRVYIEQKGCDPLELPEAVYEYAQ